MIINVITPCSRPHNLWKLYEHINIPNYRWIVVFDGLTVDSIPSDLPPTVEPHIHTHPQSIVGNSQRNYGLDLVTECWVYFLDDDTLIHHHLYPIIERLLHTHDFIHFGQYWNYTTYHNNKWEYECRLSGEEVKQGWIDTAMFLTHHRIIAECRWIPTLYEADGVWGEEMYQRANNPIWVDKCLSWYNMLETKK